mgnify:CR=1 FL=1
MFSLPRKELKSVGFNDQEIKKVIAFGEIVASKFPKSPNTVDLCAGSGICAFFLLYNGLADKVTLVDVRKPLKFLDFEELFRKRDFNFKYITADIRKPEFSIEGISPKTNLITSIHPCGYLADSVIRLALQSNSHLALMTCCHRVRSPKYDLENPPDPRLMLYEEPSDYYDLVRQRFIQEQGWECDWKEIPRKITPRNHVLVASPRKI